MGTIQLSRLELQLDGKVQVSSLGLAVAPNVGKVQVSRIKDSAPPPSNAVVQVSKLSLASYAVASHSVDAYSVVNVPPESLQTGGAPVSVPTFVAPALKDGSVLTFATNAGVLTITVKPHATFMLSAAGVPVPLEVVFSAGATLP